MSKRFFIFSAGVFAIVCFAFSSVDDPLETLLQKLSEFRKNYKQEKVHLHLDKPFYSVGDTVYFKAYVVDAEKNFLSEQSSILYVDLVDAQNRLRKSFLFPIYEGLASGNIAITDSVIEGNYKLRAYTKWMRNFSEDYFFNQTIAIGNALTSEVIADFGLSLPRKEGDGTVANMRFQYVKGSAVSNKDATYSVLVNSKEVLNGKGITDENGNLQFAFRNNFEASGEVIVELKLSDKKVITRKFPFSTPTYEVRFFPEGGQMIDGIASRVAFKAIGPDGSGASATGEIIDDVGTKVADLASSFAGIGSFVFLPNAGVQYAAIVRFAGGLEKKYILPKVEEQGFMLSIDGTSEADKLSVKIAAKGSGINNDVILVAQSNNIVHFTSKTKLSATGINASLSKKRFPTGITQFTLFNSSYQPVAERLVFIQHDDGIKINIASHKTSYAKREKVKMTLNAVDSKGEGLMGSFSVAVVDAGKVSYSEEKQNTILADLLLTSDLHGYIQNPNYYFTDVGPKKIKELDELLLTHGWRRFFWKDILADKFPSLKFAAEDNIQISGRVTTLQGSAIQGGKVTLLIKGRGGFIKDTITNGDGRFFFQHLQFSDSASFTVSARDHKGSSLVKIELDQKVEQPATLLSAVRSYVLFVDTSFSSHLKSTAERFDIMKQAGEFKSATVLAEVKVNAKKLTKVQEAVAPSANLNGPGNADQIITYEDLKNCNDLGSCLAGKVAGVVFKITDWGKVDAFSTRALASIGDTFVARPMLLVVDGVAQPRRITSIADYPATDIQSIEILRSGARLNVYGPEGSSGVIVITTRRGNLDYNGLDKVASSNGILFGTIKGFHSTREFYAPDYSSLTTSTIPDLRSTVYWKPHLITDANGKASFEFYTSDGVGEHKIIVEGISREGKLGRAVFSYSVR